MGWGKMENQALRTAFRVCEFLKIVCRTVALTMGILIATLTAFSQSSTGRILGDVRDASDAAIVGASVEITDVERGVTRTTVTDGAGEYLAPNLDPGVYRLTVTSPGFKRFERTNVQVEVAGAHHAPHLSAVAPGERDDGHSARLRGLDGLEHVLRIARCGDAEQEVAGFAQSVGLNAAACQSVEAALRFLAARDWAVPPRILIAGSLYLAGLVLEANGTLLR